MLKIEISAQYGPDVPTLRAQVDEAMSAIGFTREGVANYATAAGPATPVLPPMTHTFVAAPTATVVNAPEPAADPAPTTRKRRTKAEMEADKAAPAPTAAISTGAERVGPEDDPETVAQDEADEAAEAEANRPPAAPATRDDVRAALGDYVRVYGMAAAQQDGVLLFKKVFGDEIDRVSAIPDDPAAFAQAVAAIRAMVVDNPYGRSKVDG